jgi:hypothetical protein
MAVSDNSDLVLGKEQVIRFSADLFAFLTPSKWHPVWGNYLESVYEGVFTGNAYEATHYLGIVFLLLVVFFQQNVDKRERFFWQFIGLLFLVISLGPNLHLFGMVTKFPLTYELIDSWPVISVVRAVARAGVVVGVAMAVMLGLVLSKNIRRKSSLVLLVILIVVEFAFFPVKTQSVELSGVYQDVKMGSGKAIIELPVTTNYRAASRSLFASLSHGKEVVGNIALERAEEKRVFEEVRSFPILRQLLFLRTTHLIEGRNEFFDQGMTETLVDVLRWLDVEMMVVHFDSLSDRQREAVDYLMVDKMGWSKNEYDDAVLYSLKEPVKGDSVFMARDSGWENVGYDPEEDCVFAEVPNEATLTIYNVDQARKRILLDWQAVQGEILIGGDSQAGTAFGDRRVLEVVVAPGKTTLPVKNSGLKKAIIKDPVMRVVGEE